MSASMIVRRATPADYDAAAAVTVAAYEPFLLGPEDPYADRLRDTRARDTEAELWVAVDGEELLGCVTLTRDGSPWREVGVGDEGEFRMLAVSPAARRRGVGQALVQQMLDECRSVGATRMVLSSLPEMTVAHALYTRMGFERAPERDWSPIPGTDLWAFVLDLAP